MSSISPNGSEDRLQQLECTKNQSLQHLQSEKELQTRKLALLKAKTQELRRLQQRCFKLEKKSAKLSDKILNKEEEIENLEAENKENASKLRVVTREIGEAEEERKQKLKYYDLQRQEIQKFEEEVEKGFSTLQSEVESLETTAAKMESAMANMRDGEIYVYGNDWENSFEAEIGTPLSETKRKLSSKLASSHSTKRILEQQLESTLTAQDDERNKLLHVMEKQKSDLCLLQRENQDLEEKVFEAMRKRDDRKKELENINNRIAELTNLKCRFVFALTIL